MVSYAQSQAATLKFLSQDNRGREANRVSTASRSAGTRSLADTNKIDSEALRTLQQQKKELEDISAQMFELLGRVVNERKVARGAILLLIMCSYQQQQF